MFSLALRGYSPDFPESEREPAFGGKLHYGGELAFGGVPAIPSDNRWVLQPIQFPFPGSSTPCIEVDGFTMTPFDPIHEVPIQTNRLPFPGKVMAVISGIPKIIIPADLMEHITRHSIRIKQHHKENNIYIVSCNDNIPDFSITIERRRYTIFKDNLIIPAPQYGEDMCELQLEPSSNDRLVLGDAFLRSVVVVFDYSRRPTEEKQHGVIRIAGQLRSEI